MGSSLQILGMEISNHGNGTAGTLVNGLIAPFQGFFG